MPTPLVANLFDLSDQLKIMGKINLIEGALFSIFKASEEENKFCDYCKMSFGGT